MDYFEEELDLTNSKIRNVEESLADIQAAVMDLATELKQTQQFLIKLAHNQAEITKRVTKWPFIAVPEDRKDSEL
jgi:phage shock protein A